MPKVDLRNEVGMIVRAISKIVLSKHIMKIIYGNVKYAKAFIQAQL
jgi:hypothetical protein